MDEEAAQIVLSRVHKAINNAVVELTKEVTEAPSFAAIASKQARLSACPARGARHARAHEHCGPP